MTAHNDDDDDGLRGCHDEPVSEEDLAVEPKPLSEEELARATTVLAERLARSGADATRGGGPTVVLQRGHYGRSSGKTGTRDAQGRTEAEFGYELSLAIADLGLERGYKIVVVDADPARYPECDLFVSLHQDGSDNRTAKGASVGYPPPSQASKDYALIWKRTYKAAGHPFHFRDDNYTPALSGYYAFGSVRSSGPEMLAEHGFATHPEEGAWMWSNIDRIARAHVDTWDAYFRGIEPKSWAEPAEESLVGRVDTLHQPILAPTKVSLADAQEWASTNDAAPVFVNEMLPAFWKADDRGVDRAIAAAQCAHETNWGRFTGVVSVHHRNPCGLKVREGGPDSDPDAHFRFSSWQEGAQAQIDHLALYAGAPLAPFADSPDPRHFPQIHGQAPTILDLGANWAPSPQYGEYVARLHSALTDYASSAPAPSEVATPATALPDIVLRGNLHGYTFGTWRLVARDDRGQLMVFELADDGNWRTTNVSQTADRAQVAGNPHGYVLGQTQHIVARDSSGHIVEFYWRPGSGWRSFELSREIGNQPIVGDPFGYSFAGSQHVLARSPEGHLLEWYWSAGDDDWQLFDFTAEFGLTIVGNPFGLDAGTGGQQIFVRSSEGRLMQLDWGDGWWELTDVSEASGGQRIAGSPHAFLAAGRIHVIARSAHDELIEFAQDSNGNWSATNVTRSTGGQPIVGDSTGYGRSEQRHLVARSANGDLIEFDWTKESGWSATPIDGSGSSNGDDSQPFAFTSGGRRSVAALNSEGAIQQFSREPASTWNPEPPLAPSFDHLLPRAPVEPGTESSEVRQVQQTLVSLGLLTASQMATGPGMYGPQTASAITNFQKHIALKTSGRFTKKTRTAMLHLLTGISDRRNQDSLAVRGLQNRLIRDGYLEKSLGRSEAGEFGPVTRTAIGRLQSSEGLVVDHVVGPNTFRALFKLGPPSFAHPLPGARVTSPFNPNRMHPTLNKVRPHQGMDVNRPQGGEGARILASADGAVIFTGEKRGYGKTVMIDHGNGYTTLYAHARTIRVRKGARVNRGQHIADVGRTGNVSGPHLHFEIREGGTPRDPRHYVTF